MRPISYRDMVVLMRSMPWAPTMMEEFKQLDIPVYAELTGGYFEAVEVTVILSLLQVIDNPYQDIPLAAVLRSPIVGFNEGELAAIRMMDKTGAYYEALKKTMQAAPEKDLQQKAARFYRAVTTLADESTPRIFGLIHLELYRETGYYDYVGGMPGGKQRQANLRTLFDRARAYESLLSEACSVFCALSSA